MKFKLLALNLCIGTLLLGQSTGKTIDDTFDILNEPKLKRVTRHQKSTLDAFKVKDKKHSEKMIENIMGSLRNSMTKLGYKMRVSSGQHHKVQK